jgi:SAM-dependent methyltransferase
MIQEKIKHPGFYCACDTQYLNTLAKALGSSINRHAPWAHMHFHVFDGTDQDRLWCLANGFTYSSEPTPREYSDTPEQKKAYWVNARFMRIPDLFHDDTAVISLDADSIMIADLSRDQFDQDMHHSWVTTSANRGQRSLGSAVGFAADQARHYLKERLQQHLDHGQLYWYLDQEIMDLMLEQGVILEMDLRYSDFKMRPHSYVWTGKGERKSNSVLVEKRNLFMRTPSQRYALDDENPHLGGNFVDSDPATWCPSAWQYVIEQFDIKSVMDVGSGRGHAARWFYRQGLEVTAIEGLSENVQYSIHPAQLHDITQGPYLTQVDLVNCIEVVEHIEEQYLDHLMTTLTQGRLVLMTHAVPGQKGYHHVNCQPSQYWIDHFDQRGYRLLQAESEQLRKLAGQDGGKHIARNGMLFVRD